MKTMKKILGLFLLSIVFVSCGSDDDKPEVKPVTVQKELRYATSIQGFANDKATIKTTLKLKDQFEHSQELVASKWVNLKNFLSVEGINALDKEIVLTNFKVTIGAQTANLGTCKVNATGNAEFAPDTEIAYEELGPLFKAAFEGLTTSKAKEVEMTIEFTPSKDLNLTKDKVFFKINVYGDLTYNTYPNGK